MIHGDMRTYANGRKKKYNAWSSKSSKPTWVGEYKMSTPYRRGGTSHIKSLETTVHDCSKPERKEYTGTLVKGISTMHKSNAVPIIDESQAREHASMRR